MSAKYANDENFVMIKECETKKKKKMMKKGIKLMPNSDADTFYYIAMTAHKDEWMRDKEKTKSILSQLRIELREECVHFFFGSIFDWNVQVR